MELNEEQKTVCRQELAGPVKIMAGAGTGKTRVLVARYIKSITEDRLPPDRILALTFTNKAAAEMKKRIFDEVKKLGDPSLLWSLYGAWIMNFHGFGRRILAENAPAFGIDPALEVANGVDTARIRRSLRNQFEAGRLAGMPAMDSAAALPPKEFGKRFDKFIKIMNKCRSLLLRPSDLERALKPEDHSGYRAYVESAVAVWKAYEAELRRRKLIDFEDMIELVAKGLKGHPDVRAKYTNRFDFILVDEFQDTSDAQNELLRLLSGGEFGKVTVVGDEKQSIYRWRDARVENIRRFPGDSHVLKRNYRSTQGILDLAFHFICRDPYFEKRNRELYLEADRGGAGLPVVLFHPADSVGHSVEAEAKALAAWIQHLTGDLERPGFPPLAGPGHQRRPLDYEDISILLRSLRGSSGLDSYEKALRDAGIPYSVVGGANALEKTVYRKILALLSLVASSVDIHSLVIMLESKPFLIDDAALQELFKAAHRLAGREGPLTVDIVLSAEAIAEVECEAARSRCARLGEFLSRARDKQAGLELRTFLMEILEDSSFYLELFENQAGQALALSLTKELISIANELRRRNEATLGVLLEHLRRRIDDREFGEKTEALLPPGRVRIMTIHQAKGLEFPAVAVAGIRRPANESAGFFVSRTRGLFLNEDKTWDRSYDQLEERDLERATLTQESRCLLYVAMTRAEDYLFVSSPHPEGIDGKKETLFADVLSCARDQNLDVVEIREPPECAGLDPAAGNVEAADSPAVMLTAARDWQSSRLALETSRAGRSANPAALPFVNWQALHSYAQCPRKYYYRQVAGIGEDLTQLDELNKPADGPAGTGGKAPPTSKRTGVDPAQYGTFIHKTLEELMGRPPTERTVQASRLAALYDQAGLPPDLKAATTRKAAAILDQYRETSSARGEVKHLEKPFYYRLDRAVYHGVFDRLDEVDGGFRVVDYKTGKPEEKHKFQIRFYIWAVRNILNAADVGGSLVYLDKAVEIINVVTGPGDLDMIDRPAESLDDAVKSNRFEASPGEICQGCPYELFCDSAASLKEN